MLRTLKDALDHLPGIGTNITGPVDKLRRRPFQHLAVRLRHMFRQRGMSRFMLPEMRSHSLPSMIDFHDRGGVTDLHYLLDQTIGDGITMLLQLDVIIRVNPVLDDVCHLIIRRRQRRKAG